MSIIIVTVLFGGFALAAAGSFFRRVRRCFQWREKAPMPLWGQLLLILPPLALSLAIFGRPLLAVPEECPVQYSGLEEVTAPVDRVQEYLTHQATGRSVQTVKSYRIYLQGCEGNLYIPSNYRFDQDAFLRWAGPDEATFLYARTGGRLTVYQIQRGSQVFLDYAFARERLTTTFLTDLFAWLTMLLFALGGSVYLPEFLSPKDRAKLGERIAVLILAAMMITAFVIVGHLVLQPRITDTPADTSDLLSVTVEEGVTLTLPRGWQAESSGSSGCQWYRAQDKVSSCFQAAYYIGGSTGDDWYNAFLADFRAQLLETFLKKPNTGKGPFLEEFVSSSGHLPGTDFLISEGWGTSNSGSKNHFLMVLLPKRQIAVVMQSSSKRLSWAEMQDYVEEWIWPLLGGLEVD